jgi:hypothetical protein
MSRGFDGPEIDDFHGPERDASRGPESNSRAGWTPSGGWKGFAGRRNGPISATGKPAEPLAATARLYLARSESSWSSPEPAARTMWIATGPTNCAIPSCMS